MATTCVIAAMTTWLVVGIWKYEAERYNTLADFITNHQISGRIDVVWDPDLYQAWPQFSRTLGYRFDDDEVLRLAVEYRRGNGNLAEVFLGTNQIEPKAGFLTIVQYNSEANRWIVANH
jgi:hypothetical protein